MPKLNIPLLFQIQAHLAEDPRRYKQHLWAQDMSQSVDAPVCNTAGCIGGWAVFLTRTMDKWKKYVGDTDLIPPLAQKLLGLTRGEAEILFASWNQNSLCGPKGVQSMVAKIQMLLKDRKKFAKYRGKF